MTKPELNAIPTAVHALEASFLVSFAAGSFFELRRHQIL